MRKIFKLAWEHNKTEIKKRLALVLSLELLSVLFLWKLNQTYGGIYGGIKEIDAPLIWKSIITFCALAGVLVVIQSFSAVQLNRLSFALRQGLTNFTFINDLNIPSPAGQRVQEDLKRFGEIVCDLGLALLRAILKIPIFLSVIVTLTHWYTGLILIAAVIIGTWLTKFAASKLIHLQSTQESLEAAFRIDPNSTAAFASIKKNYLEINKKLKMLLFTQNGLDQGFVLLPFILLLPLYIAKSIGMDAFFQSVNALGHIVSSLLVLIDNRQLLVSLGTNQMRLKFLTQNQKEVFHV